MAAAGNARISARPRRSGRADAAHERGSNPLSGPHDEKAQTRRGRVHLERCVVGLQLADLNIQCQLAQGRDEFNGVRRLIWPVETVRPVEIEAASLHKVGWPQVEAVVSAHPRIEVPGPSGCLSAVDRSCIGPCAGLRPVAVAKVPECPVADARAPADKSPVQDRVHDWHDGGPLDEQPGLLTNQPT